MDPLSTLADLADRRPTCRHTAAALGEATGTTPLALRDVARSLCLPPDSTPADCLTHLQAAYRTLHREAAHRLAVECAQSAADEARFEAYRVL